MALGDVATVTLEDSSGNVATVKVSDITNGISSAKAIADYMATHSDARVISYGISLAYTGDSTDEGDYDQVAQKMVYLFKDANTRKTLRFSVPAIRDEDVTTRQQATSDAAEDVKDLLQGQTGKTLVYRGGYLSSRNPGDLDTALTGV